MFYNDFEVLNPNLLCCISGFIFAVENTISFHGSQIFQTEEA